MSASEEPLVRKMFALDYLLTADVFYGQSLPLSISFSCHFDQELNQKFRGPKPPYEMP